MELIDNKRPQVIVTFKDLVNRCEDRNYILTKKVNQLARSNWIKTGLIFGMSALVYKLAGDLNKMSKKLDYLEEDYHNYVISKAEYNPDLDEDL